MPSSRLADIVRKALGGEDGAAWLGTSSDEGDSNEIYRLVVEHSQDLITLIDLEGRLLYMSPAAERVLGYTVAEMHERPALSLVHPDDVEEAQGSIARAVATGSSGTTHARIRHRDGRWLVVEGSTTAIRDASGEPRLLLTTSREVTDRVHAEERLRFVAEASSLLASTLDPDETLARIARLAIPTLADWCIVDVLAEDGRTIRQVAVAAADPDKEELLREMRRRYQPTLETPQPAAYALREGKTAVYPEFTTESLAATVRDEEHLRIMQRLDPVSAIAVPLVAAGHTVGALTLAWSESRRTYTEDDIALATEVASRAALAVENARLYDRAQTAAAVSEQTVAQLETLLATAPIGLGFWDRDLRYIRINDALAAINGISPEEHLGRTMPEVLGELGSNLETLFRGILESGEPQLDLEVAGETPATPRGPRYWLANYYPVRSPEGEVSGIGAVVVDITERKHLEETQRFMAEASTVLASSLDYETTLARVAELAVPGLADWCTIDMAGSGGKIERLAVAHSDPSKVAWAKELEERAAPNPDDPHGVPNVLRTGEAELVPEITDELLIEALRDDPELLEIIRELGLESSMIVPLVARGRVLGTITLISECTGRRFDESDLAVAKELGRRAAIAVDNARLFSEADRRGDAARVLEYVGDGVFMLDRAGQVRLWNPAAETITGLPASEVVGRPVGEAVPGWSAVSQQIPVAEAPGAQGSQAQSVPLELPDRELWLSIAGVGFPEGTVYAFRDLTEERALDELKTDFVSTVSHELRTPLAAIYGAALTLQRADLRLEEEQRASLLTVVASEADRLARTVNDILWASRLDSSAMHVAIESCDAAQLAKGVVAAAQAHVPEGIAISLEEAAADLPAVAADPDKVRQVLVNLVDNAVKYSPDGGRVDIAVESQGRMVRFTVRDRGLGIPPSEQRRIFDKFYRLDPQMTRGVGGTGLGLYICRELVRRMEGRIWVESREGAGSTFAFELPATADDTL